MMKSLPLTWKRQRVGEKVESFKMTHEKNGTCFKIDNLIFKHIYKHNKKKEHDMSKNWNYFLSSTNDKYQSPRLIDYHKMFFG